MNKIYQENIGSFKHPYIIYVCENKKCRKRYSLYWKGEYCSEHDKKYQQAVGEIVNKAHKYINKKSQEARWKAHVR